jgi:hypothetical protein
VESEEAADRRGHIDEQIRVRVLEWARIISDANLTWDGIVESLDDPRHYEYGQGIPEAILGIWGLLPLEARLVAFLFGNESLQLRKVDRL